MTADDKYQLAVSYWKTHERQKAWDLFLEAYREGHVLAGASIGDFYYYGVWGERDYQEAIHWFMIGANAGVPKYYHAIGSAYHQMYDYQQAVIWYRKAANLGYSYACFDLGYMYENGDGVIEDRNLATKYYKQGAALGDTHCMEAVGRLRLLNI